MTSENRDRKLPIENSLAVSLRKAQRAELQLKIIVGLLWVGSMVAVVWLVAPHFDFGKSSKTSQPLTLLDIRNLILRSVALLVVFIGCVTSELRRQSNRSTQLILRGIAELSAQNTPSTSMQDRQRVEH